MRLALGTILIISLIACETKVYDQEGSADTSALANNNIQSELDFDGITGVSQVTDSSASISWASVSSALEYHIFIIEEESAYFFARVKASQTDFTLEGLESDTEYLLQVRALDKKGLLDPNAKTISIKTLAKPDDSITLKRVFPIKVHDVFVNPQIEISGLKVGERVSLYSDNCSTKVAEEIARSKTLLLESADLVPDFSYQFHVKRTGENGFTSDCSSAFVTYHLSSCPDGYVLVSDGSNRGVSEFCVMKYEARAWDDLDEDNFVDVGEVDMDGCRETSCLSANWGTETYRPGSVAEGRPWRLLSIEKARTECQSLGQHYDLISNREWMVIAEHIERNPDNWNSGVVGSGCLFRGNNGGASVCDQSLGEVTDRVSNTDPKASLGLSSAPLDTRVIWDFSGNVQEWVTWGNERDLVFHNFMCNDQWSEIGLNFCGGVLNAIEFMPKNPANVTTNLYNSSFGLGQLEGGSGNILARGGSYLFGNYAGVFSGSFAYSTKTAREDIGFRCVFRRADL